MKHHKEYLNFEGRSDIVRDSYSKAIINKDVAGLMAAKKKKQQHKKMMNVEHEIFEIKKMLKTVIDRLQQEQRNSK